MNNFRSLLNDFLTVFQIIINNSMGYKGYSVCKYPQHIHTYPCRWQNEDNCCLPIVKIHVVCYIIGTTGINLAKQIYGLWSRLKRKHSNISLTMIGQLWINVDVLPLAFLRLPKKPGSSDYQYRLATNHFKKTVAVHIFCSKTEFMCHLWYLMQKASGYLLFPVERYSNCFEFWYA